MGIKILKNVDVAGKTVLVRADYNVPIREGRIADDYRIKQSIPTLKYLLDNGAKKLVIISHLGRPESAKDKSCTLRPIASRLAQLLGRQVYFEDDCVGEATQKAIASVEHGVFLLENLRFHKEEEKNDPAFAKELAQTSGANLFVQDGFGVVHRAHASTDAIARVLPAVAGLLLAHEVEVIEGAMKDPARPLMAVVGGAKIADKIDVLERFIEVCDLVAIGGALANDFLVAEGIKVGGSLVDKDQIDKAKEIIQKARKAEKERAFNFLTPVDVVVSTSLDGRAKTRVVDIEAHCLADIESYPKQPKPHSFEISADEKIGDIGPSSASLFAGAIKNSRTVIWSGTLGVTETKGLAGAHPPFSHSTRLVAGAMIGASNVHAQKPFSIVGGGDTTTWVEEQKLVMDFNHVSTGGSASLELMAGHELPGIEVLKT